MGWAGLDSAYLTESSYHPDPKKSFACPCFVLTWDHPDWKSIGKFPSVFFFLSFFLFGRAIYSEDVCTVSLNLDEDVKQGRGWRRFGKLNKEVRKRESRLKSMLFSYSHKMHWPTVT